MTALLISVIAQSLIIPLIRQMRDVNFWVIGNWVNMVNFFLFTFLIMFESKEDSETRSKVPVEAFIMVFFAVTLLIS